MNHIDHTDHLQNIMMNSTLFIMDVYPLFVRAIDYNQPKLDDLTIEFKPDVRAPSSYGVTGERIAGVRAQLVLVNAALERTQAILQGLRGDKPANRFKLSRYDAQYDSLRDSFLAQAVKQYKSLLQVKELYEKTMAELKASVEL